MTLPAAEVRASVARLAAQEWFTALVDRAVGFATRAVPAAMLHPPHDPHVLIERCPPAAQRFDFDARLTAIIGHAGTGKTVLASQCIPGSGHPDSWGWLNLWAGANRAEVFWAGLARAVEVATHSPVQVDRSAHVPAAVLSHLHHHDQPVWVVLDDFDTIDDPDVVASFDEFLRVSPSNLRMVLAGRRAPQFHMARFRARGELCEIGWPDLLMTMDECLEMLRRNEAHHGRGRLTDAAHDAAGWPALAYLLAIEGQADDGDTGGSLIRRFVLDEVISPLPEPVRTMAEELAFLPRLTRDLVGAVVGEVTEQQIGELVDRGLVHPTGGGWYRWGPHVAEALRWAHAGRVPRRLRLHARGRAASWLGSHGELHDAITNALAADLHGQAFNWIKELERAGRVDAGQLCEWLEQLPDSVLESDVDFLRRFMAAPFTSSRPELGHRLVAIERGTRGSRALGDISVGYGTFDPIATAQLWAEGDCSRILEVVGALDIDDTPPRWRYFSVWLESLCLACGGDDQAAEAVLDGALAEPSMPDEPENLATTQLARALLLARLGQEVEAERTIDSVPATGNVLTEATRQAAVATVLMQRGRHAEAVGPFRLALECGSQSSGASLAEAFVRLDLVRALTVSGHPDALAEAGALARTLGALADPGRLTMGLVGLDVVAGASRYRIKMLTERERQILLMMRSDLSLRAIASELSISANTMKTHTRSIYRKLAVDGRRAAVEVLTST